MSDTTIDEILGHDKDSFGFVCNTQLDEPSECNCSLPKRKSALYDLILKEVVGEDDKDVRGTTQNPDNPAYHTKRAKFKNELRAEQRNKLAEIFGDDNA